MATHGFCKKGHFDLIEVGLLWKKKNHVILNLSRGVTQNWWYCPQSDELLKSRSLTALIFTQQFLSSELAGEVRISSAFMGGIFRQYLPTSFFFPPSSYSRKVVVRHEDVELAPDVHKVDNAINRINLYPLDSAIGFPNIYHWIVIYSVDSVIHLLNSRGLASSKTRKDGRKRASETIGLKNRSQCSYMNNRTWVISR